MNITQLLSIDELAAYLQIPKATLYAWRYRGHGPAGYRLGGHVRYRVADVESWIESCSDAELRPQRGALD